MIVSLVVLRKERKIGWVVNSSHANAQMQTTIRTSTYRAIARAGPPTLQPLPGESARTACPIHRVPPAARPTVLAANLADAVLEQSCGTCDTSILSCSGLKSATGAALTRIAPGDALEISCWAFQARGRCIAILIFAVWTGLAPGHAL
jgi:hypothetical protein